MPVSRKVYLYKDYTPIHSVGVEVLQANLNKLGNGERIVHMHIMDNAVLVVTEDYGLGQIVPTPA